MERVYQALSNLRYYTRMYLAVSTKIAATAGLAPQQYMLMLTIAGLPDGQKPYVSVLADRMVLEHNSIVELLNRAQEKGLVIRAPDPLDRRYVLVYLTPQGQSMLASLAGHHLEELLHVAPGLLDALQTILSDKELLEAFGDDAT